MEIGLHVHQVFCVFVWFFYDFRDFQEFSESIGVVFARARMPNQKNWFLPIWWCYIGGPLANFFFQIFAILLGGKKKRAFQDWKHFEGIGKCLYFEFFLFPKNSKIASSFRKNEKSAARQRLWRDRKTKAPQPPIALAWLYRWKSIKNQRVGPSEIN